jgi:hypothetical protein
MAHIDPRALILADTPPEWQALEAEAIALLRPALGLLTPAQAAQLARVQRSRWFLLRNRGKEGYAFRCGRCGAVHEYFTLHCIERPFNGLTQVVGVLTQRLGPKDTDFFSVALGAIEPIERDRARQTYERLRLLGYPPADLLGTGPAPYSRAERELLLGTAPL